MSHILKLLIFGIFHFLEFHSMQGQNLHDLSSTENISFQLFEIVIERGKHLIFI